MMQKMFALSLGFAGVILAVQGAEAQGGARGAPCAPRAAVVAELGARWAETRRAIGLAANGMVMEVFAAPAGGWTITVTTPEGLTCLIASGQGYEALAEELPARGEPA